MQDTSIAAELEKRYRNRMDKRLAGKPYPVQLLMERSFSAAVGILNLLADVPFITITSSVFFFCKDVRFQEIVKLYDAQIELAGAAPDKFVFGLHSFYNDVVSKVKKSGQYRELIEFLGEAIRLRYEKQDVVAKNIINAYTMLVLQSLEYVRPDKFDLTTCVVGIGSDGSLICADQPFPFVDVPGIKLRKLLYAGSLKSTDDYNNAITRLYQEQGITTVHNREDAAQLNGQQRLQANTYAALLPFINEYTFDIIPEIQYCLDSYPFMDLNVAVEISKLKETLKRRKRTLPTNGVQFQFYDQSGELQSALLKEILYQDAVYLLYRIRIKDGDLSGYYDTSTGYFYSFFHDTPLQKPYQILSALILYLYATQVVNGYELTAAPDVVSNAGQTVQINAFGMGGKLKDVYHKAERGPIGTRDAENYTHEAQAINGFIRRVPDGQTPSEEARRIAEELGYDLALNETYVRPFIRQTFVRKNKS